MQDAQETAPAPEVESDPNGDVGNVIPLTIGRKVYFVPSTESYDKSIIKGDEPYVDATIVRVWNDHCVNLSICDVNGKHHVRTSVTFVHDGELADANTAYAHWMPYQINQAKKETSE